MFRLTWTHSKTLLNWTNRTFVLCLWISNDKAKPAPRRGRKATGPRFLRECKDDSPKDPRSSGCRYCIDRIDGRRHHEYLTFIGSCTGLGYRCICARLRESFFRGPRGGEKHNHGGGGEDPPPSGDVCIDHPCIGSVGKWHGRAASEYAAENMGSYTKISSNRFGKILAKLPDGENNDFQSLCNLYDVLIFEWDSPNIKNLDWSSLLAYMACGGDIIWEDTKNIVKLDVFDAVIINHDSSAPSPIPIKEFAEDCFDDTTSPCKYTSLSSPFSLVNSHIEFTNVIEAKLMEYLIQDESDDEVLGLYGDFGKGCIVMTGPDNNFHGDKNVVSSNTDLNVAHAKMYAMLFDELNWVLSADCGAP